MTRTDGSVARQITTLENATPLGGGFGILSKMFATDVDLENGGAWMPVAAGVRFKVRSQMSERARDVAKLINEEYAAVNATGSLSPQQQDAQNIEMIARAFLVDWEGVTDDAGEQLACTEQTVRTLFTALPHLRRQTLAWSGQMENYKPKASRAG